VLVKGSRGDLVVWAQEHLKRADESLPVTGYFGDLTRQSVRRFQRSKGQVDDGLIGPQTWRALLDVAPRTVDWSSQSARSGKDAAAAPRSAALPALRDEIPPPSQR
jgi:peptidoglycan hydrolase-like protein with peptidoglycan-binding domain